MTSHPENKKYLEEIKSIFHYLQFERRLETLHIQLKESIDSSVASENKKVLSGFIDQIIKNVARLLEKIIWKETLLQKSVLP